MTNVRFFFFPFFDCVCVAVAENRQATTNRRKMTQQEITFPVFFSIMDYYYYYYFSPPTRTAPTHFHVRETSSCLDPCCESSHPQQYVCVLHPPLTPSGNVRTSFFFHHYEYYCDEILRFYLLQPSLLRDGKVQRCPIESGLWAKTVGDRITASAVP